MKWRKRDLLFAVVFILLFFFSSLHVLHIIRENFRKHHICFVLFLKYDFLNHWLMLIDVLSMQRKRSKFVRARFLMVTFAIRYLYVKHISYSRLCFLFKA